MTNHQHAGELERLQQQVRDGDLTADRAAQSLLEKVNADVPADERNEYLNGLREHATDGVGVRIVEQAISNVYPEHPTP
jgi:hypothetical protein